MTAEATVVKIGPQPGAQERFLASDADICIYGGSAGGGKTFSLLLEPLYHINNPGFGAVFFRQLDDQITREGGLWDESEKLYPMVGGDPRISYRTWLFPSGAKIKFASLGSEKATKGWQGSQVALFCWDELTHFSESQFFYMLSRNRSSCGVKPYIRATCNPDADSWVARFLDWWIGDDGYAIPQRAGVLRWFVRISEQLVWADTREELKEQYPDLNPKSVTFIPATIYDNPILMENDPNYLSNLQAQSLLERERLLGDKERGGNWKIKPVAGKVFNAAWFEILKTTPVGGKECRFWDLAATKQKMAGHNPDWTVGVKIRYINGMFYVVDVVRHRGTPVEIDRIIKNTAIQDGVSCMVRWEEEQGASGKRDSAHLTAMLVGFDCKGVKPEQEKILRALPMARQAEAGNVKLIEGKWNSEFLIELHNQPDWDHDDQMDAFAGAGTEVIRPPTWTPRQQQG